MFIYHVTSMAKETIQVWLYTESHRLVKSYADLTGLDLKDAYKQLIDHGFDVLCKPFADTARTVITEKHKQNEGVGEEKRRG